MRLEFLKSVMGQSGEVIEVRSPAFRRNLQCRKNLPPQGGTTNISPGCATTPKSHLKFVVRSIARLSIITVAMCATLSVAEAYTIVMRGGRRIEVKRVVQSTATTLTCEAAPNINITLQLSHIDASATERLNNLPLSELIKRARSVEQQHQSRAATGKPTLTNENLGAVRQSRLTSEQAYERRRSELGLPSAEEQARRDETENEALRRLNLQVESERQTAEANFRARAAELQIELAALDAEINYLVARINEGGDFSVNNSFAVIGNLNPFPFVNRNFNVLPGLNAPTYGFGRQNFSLAQQQLSGSLRLGGGRTQTQITINSPALGSNNYPYHPNYRHRYPHQSGYFYSPSVTPGYYSPDGFGLPRAIIAVPFGNFYASDNRELLIARLQILEGQRAGLLARWRALEEDACRFRR